jgi:hypothetical protein
MSRENSRLDIQCERRCLTLIFWVDDTDKSSHNEEAYFGLLIFAPIPLDIVPMSLIALLPYCAKVQKYSYNLHVCSKDDSLGKGLRIWLEIRGF